MEEGNGMHAGIVARAPLLGLSGLDAMARDLMCVASTHNTYISPMPEHTSQLSVARKARVHATVTPYQPPSLR